jgi:6-pyruvoyltetrahydropterin/6-carboxytetrahydropterin synthase
MNGQIGYEMTFDAGHRIVGHKGKCARLHGHTYRGKFTVAGRLIDPGFVVDFGDLKDMVNEWDHFMLLWEQDPILQKMEGLHGVVTLPFNPTAEHMAQHLAERILRQFSVHWVNVELWETPKCSARVERALP